MNYLYRYSYGGITKTVYRHLDLILPRNLRAHRSLSNTTKSTHGSHQNPSYSYRPYCTEYRTPPEADIYRHAKPASKWTYLYFLMPITCFGLSYWQFQRLEWKNNLIQEREQGLRAPPIPLDLEADPMTLPKELSWKPVFISGKWVHKQEIHMVPRVLDGKNGAHVITPLETASGDRVLVNRGFVPKEKLDPWSRPESLPSGTVTVAGTLREITPKPTWVPENDPEKKCWYWVDIPTIAMETNSQPFLIEALADLENPTKLPIGGQLHQPLSNNHLQYALTWLTLGFILTGMSYLMVKRGQLPATTRPPYVVPPKHRRKGPLIKP